MGSLRYFFKVIRSPVWYGGVICLILLGWHGRELISLGAENVGNLYLHQAVAHSTSWQPAIHAFQTAVRYYPANESAWRGLGFALWWNGQPQQARAAWLQSPDVGQELMRWATVAEKQGDVAEAIVWYQEVTKAMPAVADSWYHLGVLYQKTDQFQLAEESYLAGTQQPTFITIGTSDLYWQLGRLQNQQGQVAEAIPWYTQAIQHNAFANPSDLFQVYLAQGEALHRLECWVEAKELFQDLLQIDPQSYWGHVHLGYLVWRVEGGLQQAEQLFQRAIEIDPRQKWGFLGLAAIYTTTKQFDKARTTYEHILTLDDADATAIEMLQKLAIPTP